MTKVEFEHISPVQDFYSLPIKIELSTSRSSAIVKILMLAPMMAILAIPVMVLSARAADVSILSVALENPIGAAQAAFGLTLWGALFLWPLKRIVGRMGARRQVEINSENVIVVDKSPFEIHTWSVPLATYSGLTHHIRASLSGTRHEIILVHPDANKSVLIAAAALISQETLDRAKALLNLPEIPALQLYSRS